MLTSRMRSWMVAEIPHLECFRSVGFVHEYPRHSHSTWAIGIVDEGTGGIWHRGSNESLGPGTVIAVNPGTVHTGYPLQKTGISHSMLYVGDELVRNVLSDAAASPIFPQASIQDSDLAFRLCGVCRLLESGRSKLPLRPARPRLRSSGDRSRATAYSCDPGVSARQSSPQRRVERACPTHRIIESVFDSFLLPRGGHASVRMASPIENRHGQRTS